MPAFSCCPDSSSFSSAPSPPFFKEKSSKPIVDRLITVSLSQHCHQTGSQALGYSKVRLNGPCPARKRRIDQIQKNAQGGRCLLTPSTISLRCITADS
jgi:hypothetical protein